MKAKYIQHLTLYHCLYQTPHVNLTDGLNKTVDLNMTAFKNVNWK